MSWVRDLLVYLFPPRVDTTPEVERVEAEIEPEHVRRARSMLGRGLYCLGAGGKEPEAADPWSECAHPREIRDRRHGTAAHRRAFCDCSGFVDWCLKWSRNDPVYGWRYCDSLFRDAKKAVPGDLGYEVPITDAMVGDLVVYGSVDTDGDGDRDVVGHIGIVSRAGSTWTDIRVIHCSASGPIAVKETDGKIWARRGVVFRVRASAVG